MRKKKDIVIPNTSDQNGTFKVVCGGLFIFFAISKKE